MRDRAWHNDRVRIVVAPDSFTGTASAALAASALARGWTSVAPDDEVVTRPMSDGGPGFCEVLLAAMSGARRLDLVVAGPAGEPVPAVVVVADHTAYVESAQACGLDLVRRGPADVASATTVGVGELVRRAAARADVDTVVVGLGGSGSNDGGAGLWAGLGAGPAELLTGGGGALADAAAERWQQLHQPPEPGVHLVAATDVDSPLLGIDGASAVFGPQKGADRQAVLRLDAALGRWAEAAERVTGRLGAHDRPGAGAAGGLGFGLLVLGAERASGVELVIDVVRLGEQVSGADLVITGEGRIDATTLRGKVTAGVTALAAAHGVPCLALAGESAVGHREAAAVGIDEVWSVAELLGSAAAARDAGVAGIELLAAEVARAWSRRS